MSLAENMWWMGERRVSDMDRAELLEVVEYLLQRAEQESEMTNRLFGLLDARSNARIAYQR